MLSGERVSIGGIGREDKDILFNWINDARLVRFNAPFQPVSWASHCTWFDGLGKDPSRTILAIRKRGESGLIGTIQLFAIHTVHRSAELSIRIGNEVDQGKGFGSESLQLALQFAWDDLNLNRVYLHVFADNARAISSYRKSGFVEEGKLRSAAYINGKWLDVLVMGILKNK